LPWEAVHALARVALGLEISDPEHGDVEDIKAAILKAATYRQPSLQHRLLFDYYFYFEDDVVLPASSFEFWKRHADDLHRRGYLLHAHRREASALESDWGRLGGHLLFSDWPLRCRFQARAVWDSKALDGSNHGYADFRDRVYIEHSCPPSASCMLFTRNQFVDFLSRTKSWDYDETPQLNTLRLSAAVGLLPSLHTLLAHERIYAWHLRPIEYIQTSKPEWLNLYSRTRATLQHLQVLVMNCIANRSTSCPMMAEQRVPFLFRPNATRMLPFANNAKLRNRA